MQSFRFDTISIAYMDSSYCDGLFIIDIFLYTKRPHHNPWWVRRYQFLYLASSGERRMPSIIMLHSNQIDMFGDVVDINGDSFMMRFIPIEP
jgi:hypothetical protein